MYRRSDFRERLIVTGVALIIYGFMYFPVQTTLILILIAGIYFIIRTLLSHSIMNENTIERNYRTTRRKDALNNVRLYLSPHKSIWKDLKISNKYCSLRLGSDGVSITGTEKIKNDLGQYRSFKVIRSHLHTNEDLWEMFCLSFDHLTSYNGLLELCNRFRVSIKETVKDGFQTNRMIQQRNKNNASEIVKEVKLIELTDINNASEVELTALPGISIVMSKKIIKKREEIGGFKNINEFFVFIKLKPHMENQLRNMICVNKMKGSLKIERYQERNIDL